MKLSGFQGEEAKKAALEDTKCSEKQLFDGDCAPTLNNSFYIRNPEGTTITFKVSPKVKILMASYDVESIDGPSDQNICIEQLAKALQGDDLDRKHLQNVPYHLEIQGGEITEIWEQFLP